MRLKILVSNLLNEKRPDSKIVEIEKSYCIIGRKDADFVLKEPRCSKEHAVFYQAYDGSLHIRDMGSTNGTFVNGQKIIDAPLAQGNEIRIGKCFLSILEFESVQSTGVRGFKGPVVTPEENSAGPETEMDSHNQVIPTSAKQQPKKASKPPQLPAPAGDLKRVDGDTGRIWDNSFIHYVDEEGTESRVDLRQLVEGLGGGPVIGPRKAPKSNRR
ncbi:MAG: FHA domain-containing protein [Deltaproteobacteria bacterium]|nr:FHA domain-containing protein [Deltaproteobacteria bacterium]MBI3294734.1 FHA domain-containing protein [Deltaproteobacteria bacterium]